MKQNLILIGAPGSGKGTQSEKLKEMGYKHISTGDLLRAEVKSGSELGKEIAALIDAGNFVSDEMAMDLINSNSNLSQGTYIFDGMPRTVNQAELLLKEVIKNYDYKVIYFDIDDEKLINRLVNRRSCKACGKIHSVAEVKEEDLACSCGSKEFNHRKDDSLEAVPQRISNYHEKTKPVLDYFKGLGKLEKINADQSSEEVYQELLELLK